MSDPNKDKDSEHIDEHQPGQAEPAGPSDAEAEKLAERIGALLQAGQKGAKWFYYVAAFSIINSLLIHCGAATYFVVGMGVSLLADSLAHNLAIQNPAQAVIYRGLAMAFTVLAAGIVLLFGRLANKRFLIVFAVGMALYLLDGLVFLLFEDWLSAAFHAYVLVGMGSGLRAYWKVNQIERSLSARDLANS